MTAEDRCRRVGEEGGFCWELCSCLGRLEVLGGCMKVEEGRCSLRCTLEGEVRRQGRSWGVRSSSWAKRSLQSFLLARPKIRRT